jgi:putative ABC transport system substrate-binding protein
MKRRQLLAGLGGTAAGWPIAASVTSALAQAPRRIAFVHSGIPADKLTESGGALWIRRFFEELRALGHVEGSELVIERFSAGGDSGRFAALAAEVASSKPDVVIANSNPLVRALSQANTAMPVVGIMGDPIAGGLVANLGRPGGNLTGVSIDGGTGIAAKRLQLLKEAVPAAARIAYLFDSRSEEQRSGIAVAFKLLPAVDNINLRRAFAELAEAKTDAALISTGGSFLAMRGLLVTLAAEHGIPAIYPYREYAEAGGLLAYGPELGELGRRVADHVHLILGGTRPGDIPVHLPTTYELLVNQRAAHALGLAIPQSLLAQADEVIE